MDTVLDRPLTTDSVLAWENRQEAKFEWKMIPRCGGRGDRAAPRTRWPLDRQRAHKR